MMAKWEDIMATGTIFRYGPRLRRLATIGLLLAAAENAPQPSREAESGLKMSRLRGAALAAAAG